MSGVGRILDAFAWPLQAVRPPAATNIERVRKAASALPTGQGLLEESDEPRISGDPSG